jgi:uncharacterized membrane protein
MEGHQAVVERGLLRHRPMQPAGTTAAAPRANTTEILCELTRRYALPYTRTFVQRQVEAHAAPETLLAVVEVGQRLGLALTPTRCAPDAAGELALDGPAILHFGGDRDGFGLLVRVDDDRFHVWDGAARARTLSREELLDSWSGIAVFVGVADEPGIREPGRRWRRLHELLFFDVKLAVELGGPRSSRLAATSLLVVLTALIALGACARSGWAAALVAVLGGFSLLGIITTFAMSRVGHGRGGLWRALCGAGDGRACNHVLQSPHAMVAGVPLASIGLAFFGTTAAALGVSALVGPTGGGALLFAVGALWLAALPVSLLFTSVQLATRRICGLCMMVHGVVGAGAVAITVTLALHGARVPPPSVLIPTALLAVLVFGVLLSSSAPQLRNAAALDDAERRLAALTALPRVTLAELLSTEPVARAPSAGIELGNPRAPLHVLLFAHPLCSLCERHLRELEALLEGRGDQVSVTISIAPLDRDSPRDRRLCDAVVGLGVALPSRSFFRVLERLKRHPGAGDGDPIALLAELTDLDPATIERAACLAAPRVDRARDARDRYAEGVPTLFVNGRPFAGPFEHVAAWCDDPASLAMLGAGPAGPRATSSEARVARSPGR